MSDYNRWEDSAPEVRANTTRIHTARRKTHICSLCKRTIEIGQKYTRNFAVVDGKPEIIHQHQEFCIHD